MLLLTALQPRYYPVIRGTLTKITTDASRAQRCAQADGNGVANGWRTDLSTRGAIGREEVGQSLVEKTVKRRGRRTTRDRAIRRGSPSHAFEGIGRGGGA